MKYVLPLVVILACPALAWAADDAQARLDAKAEACISAGAPTVAKTEPNLASATEFLINDLCAREVEIAGKYRANRKLLDLLIKQQKTTMAMLPAATTTPASTPAKPADGPAAAAPAEAQKAAAAKQAKLAGMEAARISPETGELEGLPGPYSMISDLANIVLGFRSPQASADFRAFAARTLLAAREATR